MRLVLKFCFGCLLASQLQAQTKNLNDYSYVVIPDLFEFQNSPDQFEINSMTAFYLEKLGFRPFLASQSPNADRCDALYVSVDKVPVLLATKLQLVLYDCNKNVVYTSEEGSSKYKDYKRAYQDALRKVFKSMSHMNINPRELVEHGTTHPETGPQGEVAAKFSSESGLWLPSARYLNYAHNNKSYLLRKTSEGYSLYEEDAKTEDGLKLAGKIIVMDKFVRFMDDRGAVFDVVFDTDGNLLIADGSSRKKYLLNP